MVVTHCTLVGNQTGAKVNRKAWVMISFLQNWVTKHIEWNVKIEDEVKKSRIESKILSSWNAKINVLFECV